MDTIGHMQTQFWGVCGSVPAPLTPARYAAKVFKAINEARRHEDLKHLTERELQDWITLHLPFDARTTHGANTTCVTVQCDETQLVLDMGTGLRELGQVQKAQLIRDKALKGYILQSHVHWDHIQGFPFWKPVFMPRTIFDCRFTFFGGKAWDSQLELVLAGQMNPPNFPVSFAELRQTAMRMEFETVWDGWTKTLEGQAGPIKILARKLLHPQETFGYRIEYSGKTLAFTTDHEPYAAGVPRALVELVRDVDVWITDCQYTHDQYTGDADGLQRQGWGHSFPEYIAEVGKRTNPKQIYTTHHDPEASDDEILAIAKHVQELSGVPTMSASEGLIHVVG